MSLITTLLILIVVARLLGQLFVKFKQPSIVGEMLAGVILGPSVFNFIHPNAALSGISELAVFLVVLSAGLEMNYKDIVEALKGKGVIIAVLSFVIPLFSGITVGMLFDLGILKAVFLGICISITALPVTVSILQSFGLLNSDIAKYSVASSIVNDVSALMILGVILNMPEQRSFSGVTFAIFNTIWKLGVLSGLILGFNYFLNKVEEQGINIKAVSEKIVSFLGNEALFGILVLFVLVFGTASEILGFHFVIGAFFGALLIDKRFFLASRYHELEHTLSSITGGFLAPVFFAYLGLEFNLMAMDSFIFIIVVLVVSMGSKIFSGWLGAKIIKMNSTEALGIGIILNGRGIMELVVASIAYRRGFIGQDLFSTLVLMGVVTTLITPILFRKITYPKLNIAK